MFISHMIAELPRRINRWSVPVSHCSFICCFLFLFHANFSRCPNFKRQRGAILIGDRSISKKEKGPWEGSTKKWDVCSVRLLLLPFPRCLERFENSLPSSLGPAPTHGYEESRAIKGLCLVVMVAKFLDLNKKWSCNRCKYGRRKTKKIDTYDSSRALWFLACVAGAWK